MDFFAYYNVAAPASALGLIIQMKNIKNKDVAIRRADANDRDLLTRMRLALQHTMDAENDNYWPMSKERKDALPDYFHEIVSDPMVCVLICELQEKAKPLAIGMLIGRVGENNDIGSIGEIEDAWVDPKCRGRGLCKMMLTELSDFFRSQHVSQLQLGHIHGGEAGKFWKKIGFQPAVVISNSTVDQLVLS